LQHGEFVVVSCGPGERNFIGQIIDLSPNDENCEPGDILVHFFNTEGDNYAPSWLDPTDQKNPEGEFFSWRQQSDWVATTSLFGRSDIVARGFELSQKNPVLPPRIRQLIKTKKARRVKKKAKINQ
jgi:hypothetical protein